MTGPPSRLQRIPMPIRALMVFGALYLFLVGIGAMGAAFKGMGSSYTKDLLGTSAGPVVSLFIGILATTLVQSSSTTTSVVVGMVAAGAVPFHAAVYMVMGANVGTTVTNTIVSLGHLRHTAEYRRAFAAATVHDFFNLIALAILFPIEVNTGVLDWLADHATALFQGVGGTHLANPIKAVTKPAIQAMDALVQGMGGGGGVLLLLSIVMTFVALVLMVKLLKSIMVAKLENLFDRVLFANPVTALVFGLLFTVLVQSSSITTSLAVPLVGAGILTVRQVMPYTMGANIGTTITALLAALAALAASGPDTRAAMLGLTLAFHHVLFNVLGVAIVWPFRGVPVRIAEAFAGLAMRNRIIPVVYITVTFYLIPFLVVLLGR